MSREAAAPLKPSWLDARRAARDVAGSLGRYVGVLTALVVLVIVLAATESD